MSVSYVADGDLATPAYMNSLLNLAAGDTFNVKAFGAVGDGATDDTSAIQAAITAAAGGCVVFPAGVFKTTGSLTGGTSGIRLVGAGRFATRIEKASGTDDIIVTPAGIRGYSIEHLGIKGLAGTGDCIGLTADFGHVRLRDLYLEPAAGSKAVDASAGNGIDVHLQDVRSIGGTTAFDFSSGGVSINGATLIDVYANAATSVGFSFANCGYLLVTCSADNGTIGYNLGGRGTLLSCTAEANSSQGFAVVGTCKLSLITCATVGQLQPFVINASGADVLLVHPNTSTTPSGASISVGSGQVTLIGGDGLDLGPSGGTLGNILQLNNRVVHPSRTLTDAATIATDAALGDVFTVTLGDNRTMGAPTNASNQVIGQRITYIVIQDETGGRTLAWNAVFKQAWSNTGNTLGKRSSISFIYDGTNWNQDGAQSPYI